MSYHNIARLRATCPDARYRDGKKAVEIATKACELNGWKDAGSLDLLAAAYAEAGEIEQAIKWENKAIEVAPANHKFLYLRNLDFYKQGKPHRDEAKK